MKKINVGTYTRRITETDVRKNKAWRRKREHSRMHAPRERTIKGTM